MFPSWGAALPQIPQDQAAGCLKSMKQWVTNHSSFSADFLEYFCHSNGDLTDTVAELWEKTLLQGHPPSFSPFFLSSHSSLQGENLVISLDSEDQMILSPKTCGISILNTTLLGSRALREVIQLWGLSRLCRWMSPQKRQMRNGFSRSPQSSAMWWTVFLLPHRGYCIQRVVLEAIYHISSIYTMFLDFKMMKNTLLWLANYPVSSMTIIVKTELKHWETALLLDREGFLIASRVVQTVAFSSSVKVLIEVPNCSYKKGRGRETWGLIQKWKQGPLLPFCFLYLLRNNYKWLPQTNIKK